MTKKETVKVLAEEIYSDEGDGSNKKTKVKWAVKEACEHNTPELIKRLYLYYEQCGCTRESALIAMRTLLGVKLMM